MQIKTYLLQLHTYWNVWNSENLISKTGEDIKQLFIVSENEKWYSHFGKQCVVF